MDRSRLLSSRAGFDESGAADVSDARGPNQASVDGSLLVGLGNIVEIGEEVRSQLELPPLEARVQGFDDVRATMQSLVTAQERGLPALTCGGGRGPVTVKPLDDRERTARNECVGDAIEDVADVCDVVQGRARHRVHRLADLILLEPDPAVGGPDGRLGVDPDNVVVIGGRGSGSPAARFGGPAADGGRDRARLCGVLTKVPVQ